MNEQRNEAYLNLINQLLTCNQGDEPRILQENQELLDRGLIEVMVGVAQQFEEAGNENTAQWLMNMAQQLAEALGLLRNETTATANTPQDYFNFLMEVLQKIEENPNPQLIYPFLAQNRDKLDENLIEILDNWVENTLSFFNARQAASIACAILDFGNLIQHFPLGNIAANLEIAITSYKIALNIFTCPDFAKDWASTQNNLGNAYLDRIRGDKAENLEKAIAAHTEALKVRTFDAFPQDWAMTQNNLAAAYSERIRGDKAENLERAIAAYKEALKVRTFDAFPQDWAMTQNNFGNAYLDRIRGDKAENLERAITAYKGALKVYTFADFPQDWAMTQNNLASAYFDRIRGNKAENLENAIIAYQEVLKVYTFADFPKNWAMTQNNLANAYSNRIRDDKAENLEKAITAYTEALRVYNLADFPQDWAMTRNNLGEAYRNRIRGDKAENLENAIVAYKEALKVYTFADFPKHWAMTQNNLALAYSYRIRGDKAENLERAIAAYKEALKVLTFNAFPQDWARTQNNLANACLDRIRGDKAENLENAIAAYTEALKVRTFEAFPQDWATTQNNLAHAYFYRIRGDKAENLENAITSYHNALKIRTKDDYPLSCLSTARNLATLHYSEEQWQPATEAYNLAIEAVENARLEALNPQSKAETLSNAIDVFHRIVQAHLKLNQPKKALEYVERSKGRNLVELMTQKNLQPQGVSQEIIEQLNELKQRVVSEQIRLQSQTMKQNPMSRDNLTPYIQDQSYLKEYQQELDNFIEREIKTIDPIFSLTQKVEPIPFTDIQALTDAETCLLQWYLTGEKILAFVVSLDGDVKYWESEEIGLQSFNEIFDNYLKLYNDYRQNKSNQWKEKLPDFLEAFADTLQINHILTLIPNTCKRLIIIPHWFLHILPLHALPVSNSHFLKRGWEGAELHDLFPNGVQYAPSCQLLKIAQNSHHAEFNKLFAIQNPTKDLPFTDLEVNILSTFFTESQIIAKDNATKNTILPHLKSSNNHCHHFSCHGGFNLANPLESALFLANQEPLTLGEIFELRLNKCRLVTLSACETGLIDLNSISDEYIGLPSGFLFAGSPSVVSSLWTVSDLSTSFLMMKFYEILLDKNQQVSVPVALKIAQNWLQNLTVKEIKKNLAKPTFQQALSQLQQTLSSGDLFELEDAITLMQTKWKAMSPEDKPFSNPFYWAAFVASGV
jgi:CHAT domain-containing protein/tetratricopeptide (TPR) repeat protein